MKRSAFKSFIYTMLKTGAYIIENEIERYELDNVCFDIQMKPSQFIQVKQFILRLRYSGQNWPTLTNCIFKGFHTFDFVLNDHNYITLLYMHIRFTFNFNVFNVKVWFLQH